MASIHPSALLNEYVQNGVINSLAVSMTQPRPHWWRCNLTVVTDTNSWSVSAIGRGVRVVKALAASRAVSVLAIPGMHLHMQYIVVALIMVNR